MNDQPGVRQDVVEHLLTHAMVGERPSDEELQDTTLAERAMVHRIASSLAQGFTDSGLLPAPRLVTDATWRDLVWLARRSTAYLKAFEVLGRWLPQPRFEGVRLVDALKVLPADVTEEVIGHLRAAELVPAEEDDR